MIERRASIAIREENKKIKFNFNVSSLNTLLKFIRCDYLTYTDYYLLNKFMNSIDISHYSKDIPLHNRLQIMQVLVDALYVKRIKNDELLEMEISQNLPTLIDEYKNMAYPINQLSHSECEYMRGFIGEKLKSAIVYKHKDVIFNILEKFDMDEIDFNGSYTSHVDELKLVIGDVLSSLQDNSSDTILSDFTFSDASAEDTLTNIILNLQLPSSVLQTGIRQLNNVLSGGFYTNKLYVIVGGSGKFKSGTLLNLAEQIRLFNPQISPIEKGMKNCILFITLENTIEESVERIFDMYSDIGDDMKNMPVDEILDTFRNGALLLNNDPDKIALSFKYAGNLELNVADIIAHVQNLRTTQNMRPVAIIVDYIKRVDTKYRTYMDDKSRISYVCKDLKNMAVSLKCPVITAMQLNREGNAIIDAGMQNNKQDVARFVGVSSIGSAFEVVEDADWICLINPEMQLSSKKTFLTFKRLKIRYKRQLNASDYFNHPFTNDKNIRLVPDIDKPETLSIISLANDLASIEDDPDSIKDDNGNNYRNLQERNRKDSASTSILAKLHGTSSNSLVAHG